MKKSEMYTIAMVSVVNSRDFGTLDKLEVLETLFEDRHLALYREEQEAKKKAEQENNA